MLFSSGCARAKQHKAQLLEHDDLLHLVLTLKKIPQRSRTNPFRIPLPHPFHSLDSSSSQPSICLIIDDSPKSKISPSAARDKINDLSLPIAEVITLSELKSDYRIFEARRKLCNSFDLFFADRRIIPLLPKLIGKSFFKKKKMPVPIEVGRKSWVEQIRQCCGSTLMYLRTGTCSGIKIGKVSQSRDEIVDNAMSVIVGAVQNVPKKWSNIRSLHIKSVDSLALPIYQAVPEIGMKIDVGGKKSSAADDEIIQKDGEEEKEKKREVKKKKKEKNEGGTTKKKKASKVGRIHETRYMNVDHDARDEDDDRDEGMLHEEYNDE